jgi:hypothetical protein
MAVFGNGGVFAGQLQILCCLLKRIACFSLIMARQLTQRSHRSGKQNLMGLYENS